VLSQAKQGEMEAMQKYYEDRLAQMQATIVELTTQRDTILRDLTAAEEHKHTTVGLAAHTDLVERLESTERQLRDMRGKHSDLERIADVKAKMSAEVRLWPLACTWTLCWWL
jgi:hypothetical protein